MPSRRSPDELQYSANCRTARTAGRRGLPDGADCRTAQAPKSAMRRGGGRRSTPLSRHDPRFATRWFDANCASMMTEAEAAFLSSSMSSYRDLDVLDAAEKVADEINALIDARRPGELIHVGQLRDSVESIAANIREGFGRGPGRERSHSLRTARGETEETIGHLRTNFASNRISRETFWPLRNRLLTIVKMINSLLRR